jgi:hypothetical protein
MFISVHFVAGHSKNITTYSRFLKHDNSVVFIFRIRDTHRPNIKVVRDSSSNYALSNHTTFGPSQTRAILPLNLPEKKTNVDANSARDMIAGFCVFYLTLEDIYHGYILQYILIFLYVYTILKPSHLLEQSFGDHY